MKSMEGKLGAILAALDRNLQRATYTAVGSVVGLPAKSAMLGRPKTALNSCVVSKTTHLPTGYEAPDCHLGPATNSRVIRSPDELRSRLKAHS